MAKVAFITGATRGIGKQIAIEFAKDGYDIAFNYRKENEDLENIKKQIKELNVRCLPVKGDISIFDDEQASNSLQRICKFKNHLSTECIEEAINLLKSVLLKNEFNFYFHKDGKLYKKNAEGIKRVKDIKELLNEREKRCK